MKIFDFIKRKLNSGKLFDRYGKGCWYILENSLIPISLFCMVIAVILFLGRLFHKIQPWFSEIQGLILILFGLFAFWDAHRIYKILSASNKRVWSNYNFRFSINTGVVSIIASPVAFFISRRKYTDFQWFPIILFLLGFGLICLAAYRMGAFKILCELKESNKRISTEIFPSTDPLYLGLIAGFSIVGLSYLIVFLPLTLWNTAIHNLDYVDVLLFATLTNTSAKLGILGQINTLLDFSNMSHFFAFGVFYGIVTIIICVIMKMFVRKEGMNEIVIMSNGIFYGYALTIWVKYYLGASLTSTVLLSSSLSFGYVLLLYYGLRSLLDVVSKWGIRSKYEYGMGGIQSIGTAWILSRVFGDQAIIFSGVIFIVCTFITTSIFEVTIGRIIKQMYPLLPDNPRGSIVPIILSLARAHNKEFWISMCLTIIVTSIFPFFAFGIFKLVLTAL